MGKYASAGSFSAERRTRQRQRRQQVLGRDTGGVESASKTADATSVWHGPLRPCTRPIQGAGVPALSDTQTSTNRHSSPSGSPAAPSASSASSPFAPASAGIPSAFAHDASVLEALAGAASHAEAPAPPSEPRVASGVVAGSEAAVCSTVPAQNRRVIYDERRCPCA